MSDALDLSVWPLPPLTKDMEPTADIYLLTSLSPPQHQTYGLPPKLLWSSDMVSNPCTTDTGHHWRRVQTCSLNDIPPNQYRHLVVATETCTVGKWAVHTLLECCLVMCSIQLSWLQINL